MPRDETERARWAWLLLVLALVAMVWPLVRRVWTRAPASPPAAQLPAPPLEAPPDPPGYEFTLDDQPIVPDLVPLHEPPGMPGVGALVDVEGFTLAIGAPGKYRLRSEPTDSSEDSFGESRRLLWVRPDGATQVVAVRIGSRHGMGLIGIGLPSRPMPPADVVDPLDQLSPAELRGLWGVVVEARVKRLPAQLAALDPRRTCLRHQVADPSLDYLAQTVPLGVRCLVVQTFRGGLARAENQLPYLARLDALVALEFWNSDGDVDATWFQGMKDLRYLKLAGRPANAEALGRLTALRRLDFGYYQEPEIDFARSLTGLEELHIDYSPRVSARPLGIDAPAEAPPEAPPFRLPEDGLPALRSLFLLSPVLSDAEVARFTGTHPRCRVRHHWIPVLREALAQVTRIRVRRGGTCHSARQKEKTLFEVYEPSEIRRVIEAIDVSEEHPDADMCCGSPSLEFYAGERLAATLGFHHGKSLRWQSGWPGDGQLKTASSAFLCDWLKRHAPEPLSDFEVGSCATGK
jgi:hypothetical protein